MIDRARLTIIASVPVAMTFNLFLLNYYFNPQKENINIQDSIKEITNERVEEEKEEYIYENRTTYNSSSDEDEMLFIFSPPAPHTFIGNDSDSYMEEEEIRNQGVILK